MGTVLLGCNSGSWPGTAVPAGRRFSAEDSLPEPTSKPDPAVHTHAGQVPGTAPGEGIAVEDSIDGARSAVAAGHPTVGVVLFVPPPDRGDRTAASREAGVSTVAASWAEPADLLM